METTAITVATATANDLNTIAEDVQFEDIATVPSVNFLEANTSELSIEELTVNCVVPTWANQELTISHQDFINTVHDAACNVFSGELINKPEIRVSHIVRGRIPSALGKRASELLESEKTQFYQRLAFAFTIPSIHETIDGQRLELCIGGVRKLQRPESLPCQPWRREILRLYRLANERLFQSGAYGARGEDSA